MPQKNPFAADYNYTQVARIDLSPHRAFQIMLQSNPGSYLVMKHYQWNTTRHRPGGYTVTRNRYTPLLSHRRAAMLKYHCCLLLLLAAIAASAQTPLRRQGSSCPSGTYSSGDYCMPLQSTGDQKVITKSGKDCPTGFYSTGDYCKRRSGSDREAMPREEGGRCPSGWYKSGGYCLKR